LEPFGFSPLAAGSAAEPAGPSLPDPSDHVAVKNHLMAHPFTIGMVWMVDGRLATNAEMDWKRALSRKDIRRASKLRKAVENVLAAVDGEVPDAGE
jgi:hypothetical protein